MTELHIIADENLMTTCFQPESTFPVVESKRWGARASRQTLAVEWSLFEKRAVRWSLAALGACCFMSSAGAAEIILYEHAEFGGGQLTLRGFTPSIGSTGFNDRASSVVVTSGRWEVCTDADFKGQCVTLAPGEYPTLDQRLSDRISSAREVGSNSDNRGGYNDYGRGSLELFGQPDFRGRTLRLDKDAETLQGTGFNDRASSVVVTAGTWQLCSDDGYAGKCRTFTPGRYPDLGYGMAKEVSSARLVRSAREAPAVVSNGSGTGPQASGVPSGRIVLYGDEGLNGESVAAARAFIDLGRTSLGEDGAASAYVESGSWMLCTNPNFGGSCVVVGPGRYDRLNSVGLRRPIESVKPVPVPAAAAPVSPGPREGMELFSEAGFRGERLPVNRDVANLERANFNDRTASVIVHAGRWEFCTDSQHRGNCAVFGPGQYPRIGGMTQLLSSVRRVQ